MLFLPGEAFFSAALQHDPGLLEYGVERRVFLAGPITLLALLRTAAYGWTQEKLAEHAQEISDLGKDLYERLCTMFDHLDDLQRKLDSAVQAHNAAIAVAREPGAAGGPAIQGTGRPLGEGPGRAGPDRAQPAPGAGGQRAAGLGAVGPRAGVEVLPQRERRGPRPT